jgi:adenylate cyclase
MLNRYFAATTRVLIHEGAVINKFIGDAMMAFFNSPYPQPDHEERALRSAIKMQAAVDRINIENLRMGIGIHAGIALIGNVGGPHSRDFTAIGDTVNTASRLQSHADAGEIVVSRAVFEKSKSLLTPRNRIQERILQLKGKEKSVDAVVIST